MQRTFLKPMQAGVVYAVCVLVWRCPRADHRPMGAGQSKAQWAPMNIGPAPRLQPNSGPALRITKQRTINPVCCCSVRVVIMINCIGGLLWHKCAPRRVSVDYSQLTNNGFIERDVQLLAPLWCGHQPGGDSGNLGPSHTRILQHSRLQT